MFYMNYNNKSGNVSLYSVTYLLSPLEPHNQISREIRRSPKVYLDKILEKLKHHFLRCQSSKFTTYTLLQILYRLKPYDMSCERAFFTLSDGTVVTF